MVITLSVDATGAVSGCTIEQSSGFPMLDEQTCILAKQKGKFQPASDRKGRPIAGTLRLPGIVWNIGGELDPVANADGIAEFNIDPRGKIVGCRERSATGQFADFGGLCAVGAGGVLSALAVEPPFTAELRLTLRLGEVPTPDQSPPPQNKMLLIRQAKVLLNEAGKGIECVPIRSEGGFSTMTACPTELPEFGPTVDANGTAHLQWIVMSLAVSVLPAPGKAP